MFILTFGVSLSNFVAVLLQGLTSSLCNACYILTENETWFSTDLGYKVGPRLREPRLQAPSGRGPEFTQPRATSVRMSEQKGGQFF